MKLTWRVLTRMMTRDGVSISLWWASVCVRRVWGTNRRRRVTWSRTWLTWIWSEVSDARLIWCFLCSGVSQVSEVMSCFIRQVQRLLKRSPRARGPLWPGRASSGWFSSPSSSAGGFRWRREPSSTCCCLSTCCRVSVMMSWITLSDVSVLRQTDAGQNDCIVMWTPVINMWRVQETGLTSGRSL